jgi:hypothetical protein
MPTGFGEGYELVRAKILPENHRLLQEKYAADYQAKIAVDSSLLARIFDFVNNKISFFFL